MDDAWVTGPVHSRAGPSDGSGFTLIEVLIASVILFASITVVAESYRTNLAASRRASITAEMLTPLPLITGTIRTQLRDQPGERLVGNGTVLGVKYSFEAVSVRFEPPPPIIDPDADGLRFFPPRYRLYDVRLLIEHRALRRQFIYQELAWLPRLE